VFVGEIGEREIDFVAEKNGKKLYIQCMLKYNDKMTWERELAPFRELRDGWPRYIVSLYEGDGSETE
jgi:predicted AAA+ superfamily ATPase